MFYISRNNHDGTYGVTDTDDGSVCDVTPSQIDEYISQGVAIEGVLHDDEGEFYVPLTLVDDKLVYAGELVCEDIYANVICSNFILDPSKPCSQYHSSYSNLYSKGNYLVDAFNYSSKRVTTCLSVENTVTYTLDDACQFGSIWGDISSRIDMAVKQTDDTKFIDGRIEYEAQGMGYTYSSTKGYVTGCGIPSEKEVSTLRCFNTQIREYQDRLEQPISSAVTGFKAPSTIVYSREVTKTAIKYTVFETNEFVYKRPKRRVLTLPDLINRWDLAIPSIEYEGGYYYITSHESIVGYDERALNYYYSDKLLTASNKLKKVKLGFITQGNAEYDVTNDGTLYNAVFKTNIIVLPDIKVIPKGQVKIPLSRCVIVLPKTIEKLSPALLKDRTKELMWDITRLGSNKQIKEAIGCAIYNNGYFREVHLDRILCREDQLRYVRACILYYLVFTLTREKKTPQTVIGKVPHKRIIVKPSDVSAEDCYDETFISQHEEEFAQGTDTYKQAVMDVYYSKEFFNSFKKFLNRTQKSISLNYDRDKKILDSFSTYFRGTTDNDLREIYRQVLDCQKDLRIQFNQIVEETLQ